MDQVVINNVSGFIARLQSKTLFYVEFLSNKLKSDV